MASDIDTLNERVRVAYCRSVGLPRDTPLDTVRKIMRYGFLSGYAGRSEEEEAEVQELQADLEEQTGWPVVPRSQTRDADLSVFYRKEEG